MAPAAAADVSAVGGEAAVRVGYLQYRALYDYEARNEDELSFQTNDIILVHPEQEHEPGWLGGELNGKIGWFPEAYAQQLGENGQPVVAAEPTLQTIAEVSETSSDKGSLQDQGMLQDAGSDQPTAADTEPLSTESAVAETAAAVPSDVTAPPATDEAAAEPEAASEAAVSEQAAADVTLTSQQSVTSQHEEPVAAAVEQPEATVAADAEELNEEFVALYAYQSGEPGDLIFEAGEKIIVTKKDGEWWTGKIGDQVGVFPYNYVESASSVTEAAGLQRQDSVQQNSMVAEIMAEQTDSVSNPKQKPKRTKSIVKKDKSGKKMEIAKVLASYEATSKEQLSLQQGQMVIVRKKTESGWWQGEVGKGKKREVGWFPASYVQLLEGVGGGSTEKKSTSSVSDDVQGESFTAVYDYNGQYEDELSFKAGDVIMVTNKDDANWWQGTLGDKAGVFPSNYVEKTQ
jgi:hypothetical protein